MKDKIYVTIGLPFYNAEDFLEMAIKSIFAQTYPYWELILMDDGSTDDSLAIAKSISDSRVRVISDGKNKKLAARLNEIVRIAKYDVIMRMDADDLMSTERLERQIEELEKYPEVDLISTGTISITNSLQYIGSRGQDISDISLQDLLSRRASPLHASIVGRKAWFSRNSYDEKLKIAQDYDLWLRSSASGDFNIRIISDRLYYYREENNATAKKVLAAYKNERQMFKKYAIGGHLSYWLKSKVKSFAVYFIALLGKEDWLLKRRSPSKFNEEEKRKYLMEVEKIKRFELPKK
ncbi:glycosyltransferase family 2 protein [Muriicola marianensis]|uniref:Glycosyltransferase 2-like domain-containing protein n=1 Tax=Muriicola marianensis TaxID=1324801 RepID=A0ABQ1QTP8_9FLAO|nr:glycosyltransferase family 2 protein [Muriicola marianensis]GGD40963.1 hypothetical protein GCM10011361_05150 [Muriicola marianensis]